MERREDSSRQGKQELRLGAASRAPLKIHFCTSPPPLSGCRAPTVPVRKAQPPLSGPAGSDECGGHPLHPTLNVLEPAEKWLDSGVTLKGGCAALGVDIFTLYLLTLYLDSIKSSKGQGEGMGQGGERRDGFWIQLRNQSQYSSFFIFQNGKESFGL